MRARSIVSLSVLALILPLVALHNHIHNLLEIGRTYSTFRSYLRKNEHVLFRYPASEKRVDDIALSEPVPKIIHQIFLSSGRPNSTLSKYTPAIESCKELHPGWDTKIWTDEQGEEFMAKHYPEIHPLYCGYRQNIQRANILRYALLHHFGGVYLDLDVTCRVALDTPLAQDSTVPTLTHLPWLTPGAYPAGVNNAFILARPQHPFLAELLDRVPSRDLSWGMPYVENMLSTGCMFFSNVWMSFVLSSRGRDAPKEDRVYVLADEHGAMEPQMLRGKIVTPLFEHGGASSWHGWDAAAIVLIGKHYGYFTIALGLLMTMVAVGIWKLFRQRKRNQHRRRGSWRSFTGAIRRLGSEKQHDAGHEEVGLMKDG
ncbi:Putative glycosyltransferase, DXD sugar-binding, nucleotide-diphospho-sugar transferase [Septoria linicola]|uniref:Glycosyltransferase, DXD sugar-binding, nucleotide-diphospho-sugar transferase n=1 Tax=Septoria linicola TaxID=215465 RepID=A0A9Q9ENF3_9PEZI|nr:Putative glycosyltransferase, DXD sugar-binding, nucleotide-diphospho-sugar transferase [Septoria linicola]